VRAPSPSEVLQLREQGAALHGIDRALRVLRAARAAEDPATLERLPLGVRDALLLRARRLLLGERIEAEARCPRCDERLEFELACSDLLARASEPPARWTLARDGWSVTLRPLDSLDAAAAARAADPDAARAILLERCVTAVEHDGEPSPAVALPAAVQQVVADSLAERDPGAEWLLDLGCPACGTLWQDTFDVVDFVWRELATSAERLLVDVHTLARAYGWSEADILALDPGRRAAYLTMVQA